MEYTISVDPQTGWGYVRVAGEIRPSELPAVLAAAWEHPGYAAATCAIWDFTNGRTGYYFNDVVGLTDFIAGNKRGRGPTTVAILAPGTRNSASAACSAPSTRSAATR